MTPTRPLIADLAIPAPVPLRGMERDLALALPPSTVREVCEQAFIRYRVSGGNPPHIVIWSIPHHGYTLTDSGLTWYAVSDLGLPSTEQERALRILEILAYGFQDYFARESVCGRGLFICPPSTT